MRALIASGSGRYDDRWHPFDRTRALITEPSDGGNGTEQR